MGEGPDAIRTHSGNPLMTLTSQNGTAFELHGPGGRPAVVLIHGLGLTRQTWDGLLPALAKDYRVLAYDLYGHGESVAPPETPYLSLFSQQLLGLMDELSLSRAALIGFSLGGMINRRFAMDHPERVSALVILNSPHERGDEAQSRVEMQARDSSADGPAATLDAAIERWFTSEFRETSADTIDEVQNWVLANEPATYAECRWVLANGVRELIRPEPPITHPALVMTGENDSGSTPAMTHAIAAEITGAEALFVPGLRHMGLMERPELFAAPILTFLAKHG
jgi:pimeloyl-ACP methyl ester carboxylesterase